MTDIARWGATGWGDERWGETEGGAAHVLEANFGAAMQAAAERLGANHPLEALLQSRVVALGVGAGPAPIHPLRATATSVFALPSLPTLRFLHLLEASFAVAFTAAPVNLTMHHKMAASAIATLDVTGRLRIFHPLIATFDAEFLASATDLDLSHPLAALFIAEAGAIARYAFEMPVLIPLDELTFDDPDQFVAGSINLSPNASVENDLLGWYGENGATVERVLGPSHDGVYAVEFATPGVISTERGAIRSQADLNFVPYPGSLLWGEVYLAAPTPVVLRAWMRAVFLDGAVLEGELLQGIEVTSTGLLGEWQPLFAPALQMDGTNVLQYFELLLAPDAPSGSTTWWADTAALEWDPWMRGPQFVQMLSTSPPDEEEGDLPVIEEPES